MRVQLEKWAKQPVREHDTDAGIDLMTPQDFNIQPHRSACVDTGVHVELPHGFAGLLVSKSGLNAKHGITSTGLIDEGYTGSIRVILHNHSDEPKTFHAGDKITQLVVIPAAYIPIEIVDKISGGERGDAGFGSTGR